MINSLRDYNNLVQRIHNLKENFQIKININEFRCNYYPLFELALPAKSQATKKVLITAGIHGDEPAGVDAILTFLEKKYFEPFLDEWVFIFLPCLNPYGYEKNQRTGKNNIDLNRQFKSMSPPPEVELAKNILCRQSWNLTVELHEDCDSNGYYLFIRGQSNSFLNFGRQILDSVHPIMPIDTRKRIEGIAVNAGIIHEFPNLNEMEWWPMNVYSTIQNSECALTLETTTSYPMNTRIKAHLEALRSALSKFSNYCIDQ